MLIGRPGARSTRCLVGGTEKKNVKTGKREEMGEEQRAQLYARNLREAIASCNGAIEETVRSGMFGRMDAERLQVARVAIAIVVENLSKKYGWSPQTPKWLGRLDWYKPRTVPANLLVRNRDVFVRCEK